jgi:ATP-dependent helicase Lhr and Lhr-like helicase
MDPLSASQVPFAAPVAKWFALALGEPTPVQTLGWPRIAAGQSALLIAPTGSGKTLAAFLAGLDRLMFGLPGASGKVRLLYVSPLKALAVDVERNLRVPLAGIRQAALGLGMQVQVPSIALRSGDTPASERARFRRVPSDILITTPESLYLLLTSESARHLATVETVIVDEIHSILATKRGTHLALSLERLQRLRGEQPLQRIGLSATVRPIEAAATLLGGGQLLGDGSVERRPVEVVDASRPPALDLRIEVPVKDMDRSRLPAAERSIWPAIHQPLVDLIKQHQSTLIFVNSRTLAERLSTALNETCGESLVLAHHGAVARERRSEIEAALKDGRLRGLVATSTLELGIDMGAIDLVVLVEAPPSAASGLQRIGRAGHRVGATSEGVIYPKFRGDLLAAAATAELMQKGAVEDLHYPRNPLDVLAQQVVAIVSDRPIHKQELFDLVRRAAPFFEISLSSFESILDLLSGRYPSDEFAELRPRIVWDRNTDNITSRQGARQVAVINGGTIADRGLYGVFLAVPSAKSGRRVGELDEEMVFESRVGDVFLLGASSWRIEDITQDRVLVTPAPGQPGRMPFWHGDRAGRPLALGRAIGQLARELENSTEPAALDRLISGGLRPLAAENLLRYLRDQRQALGLLPSDEQIIVECFTDELGDYRVCVLSPFGSAVHAPWALAAMEMQRSTLGIESAAVWTDDGIVFRFPKAQPPGLSLIVPRVLELDELLQQGLAKSPLFASHFRENAARALLLPRRRGGRRTPLWAQRRRAADLMAATARYPEFPILLETLRECLSDVFDVPGLREILLAIERRTLRVSLVETNQPSPFAASLLFSYAGNFIYDADSPLAERRAHALTINQSQLRQLLGEQELRQLLDPEVIAEVIREVSRSEQLLRHPDDLHDLLIALGDLDATEIARRGGEPNLALGWIEQLQEQRRLVAVRFGDKVRYVAAEDFSRYRDVLGFLPPNGLPEQLLASVREPLADLLSRYARTHGPFCVDDVQQRLGLSVQRIQETLEELEQRGKVVSGHFLPEGQGREWCHLEVLRQMKQRSLTRLRRQVESVSQAVYAQFLSEWQGADQPRRGRDLLPQVIEQLQGAPLIASVFEREILPARVLGYHPSELDTLISSGEVVWRGLEPLGSVDGRIAFYLSERYAALAPEVIPTPGPLVDTVRQLLRQRGASFFRELVAETQAFPQELLDTLWTLVWSGEVTNDSLAPLRSRLLRNTRDLQRHPRRVGATRPRLPGSEGRWSLLERWQSLPAPSTTERQLWVTTVLLERYGVLPSEAMATEGLVSFSEIYPCLKAKEEAGKIRRGYFIEALAPSQFALPGADDRLRQAREPRRAHSLVSLAATDPANAYGAALPWPGGDARPQRTAGARVVLFDGSLIGYLARSGHSLLTFLPQSEPPRASYEDRLVQALRQIVDGHVHRALDISEIDGQPARKSSMARAFQAGGFTATSNGYFYRGAVDALPTNSLRSESPT